MMAQLIRRSAVALLVVAFVALVGCQNTPMQPTGQHTSQLVQQNGELALAVDGMTTSMYVTKDAGATLGGTNMDGNYVKIPANTLKADMEMTFKTYYNEQGALVFQIHADGIPLEKNIYFQSGKYSTIAVNKSLLSAKPDYAVHTTSNEKYPVYDGGDVWYAKVPHFSNYCWAIAE